MAASASACTPLLGVQVAAYAPSIVRIAVFTLVCLPTLGLPFFLLSRAHRIRFTHKRVDLDHPRASVVLATIGNQDGKWDVVQNDPVLPHQQLNLGFARCLAPEVVAKAMEARYCSVITLRHVRYLVLILSSSSSCGLNDMGVDSNGTEEDVFIAPVPSEMPLSTCDIEHDWHRDNKTREALAARSARLALFGENRISAPVHPLSHLLLSELMNPFFIFQVACVVLWIAEEYYMYAFAIFITSVGGAMLEACELHSNSKRLASLANASATPKDAMLVPGDSIQIEIGSIVPADCTLVDGSALVNESSLTGESAPVRKSPWNPFNKHHHAWNSPEVSLYAGTQIITARPGSRAFVTRTACSTERGRLVRNILLQPYNASGWGIVSSSSDGVHSASREVYYTLAFLLAIGITGALWAAMQFVKKFHLSHGEAILESLDLITIAVPPALPATVTFGLAFAIARLNACRIFCVRASAVPQAGHSTIICFDKTGTLTETGLDVHSVYECSRYDSSASLCQVLDFSRGNEDQELLSATLFSSALRHALACCHALTDVDGKLMGDEVDLKLFGLSGFHLVNDERSSSVFTVRSSPGSKVSEEIAVLRLLDFSSDLARQGSVAMLSNDVKEDEFVTVFVKGAPEVIASLSDPSSVPANLMLAVSDHASKGHRVLALASRRVMSTHPSALSFALESPRSALEKDLEFLGLVVLENRLKRDTSRVLSEIAGRGQLETRLITGDHAATAVCVAKQCGILREISNVASLTMLVQPVVGMESKTGGRNFELVDLDGSISPLPIATDDFDSFLKYFQPHVATRVSLVITGPVFEILPRESSFFDFVLRRGIVFARMSPRQKTELVRLLKSRTGGIVLMCGDGANDVGALREAHTGVAISTMPAAEPDSLNVESKQGYSAEIANSGDVVLRLCMNEEEDHPQDHLLSTYGASDGHYAGNRALFESPLDRGTRVDRCERPMSLATVRGKSDQTVAPQDAASLAAPFTAYGSISGALDVIRHGRAAAVASLAAFQYMFLYSVIQFSSVSILYSSGALVADGQFLFVDLFLVMPLAVLMSRSDAASRLHLRPPPGSIKDKFVVSTTLLMVYAQVLFQLVVFAFVLPSPPAQKIIAQGKGELVTRCALVTGMFVFVNLQYVTVAVALNLGPPHRKPLFSNAGACVAAGLTFVTCFVLLVSPAIPATWVGKWLEMEFLEAKVRLLLIVLACLNCITTFAIAFALQRQSLRVENKVRSA